MIEIKGVTKRFGAVTAVNDLTLTVPRRQIVGLLGQNGAGKTTTLNILTGYMPPTAGKVLVDGHDMQSDPRACKRLIGYMPETPPLYDEMTVTAYLTFVCRLKEVARRSIRAHVDDIIGLCGLEEVAHRVVGNLSRGYRQRVGLAQALCGDPAVLVLDEPTVGLDPKQVADIRALIARLGETHTILFSSHILPEVQQLCSRAAILHRGRLVQECAMDSLDADNSTIRLRAIVMMNEKKLLPALRSLPCVRRVKALPSLDPMVTECELECGTGDKQHDDPQVQLFRLLCALDAPVRSLTQLHDTLEEAFLRLTADEEVQA